ncbi:response regulator transcription factor [Marinobacterium jannaschii]|uniref:response regulator transcription factor n=1 Tax=Marinobacterium jannaschii TaxID=64970 RepID=UPI000483CE96|nr:response regulator transcription factor [Marinobacterium jannaschii]
MRILLVEDDPVLGPDLRTELTKSGYAVDLVDNGVDAEAMGFEDIYDLAVLDLGLPQRPGLEVLRNWRGRKNNIPVLVLTARSAWQERVDGFEAGADDYLGKPFHTEELLVRMTALLRRSHQQVSSQLEVEGLALDEKTQSVVLSAGDEVALTGTEYRLLRYFMHNPGRVLSKLQLVEHLYDDGAENDSNVIEAYIKMLRKKIGKERIQTKRGQGYIFVATVG